MKKKEQYKIIMELLDDKNIIKNNDGSIDFAAFHFFNNDIIIGKFPFSLNTLEKRLSEMNGYCITLKKTIFTEGRYFSVKKIKNKSYRSVPV